MRMGISVTVASIGFTLLYLAWLANRLRLHLLQEQTTNLRMRLMARLQDR
jgi:hypothetical protein